MEMLAPSGISISLNTFGELYEGAYYGRNSDAAMTKHAVFIRKIPILPVTQEIVERFAILRLLPRPRPGDLRIEG